MVKHPSTLAIFLGETPKQKHFQFRKQTSEFCVSSIGSSILIGDRLVAEDANSLREITTARMQLTHKDTEHLFLRVNEETGKEETPAAICPN